MYRHLAGSVFVGMMLCGVVAGVAQERPSMTVGSNTVITAKELEFNYKSRLATFKGDVAVVDAEVRMSSDLLTVTFNASNDVDEVTATGRVRIWQGARVARCDRAVYRALLGEVELSGHAELNRGKDVVRGDEITFWVNEERMRCRPATMVIHPEGKGNRDVMGRIGRDLPSTKRARP